MLGISLLRFKKSILALVICLAALCLVSSSLFADEANRARETTEVVVRLLSGNAAKVPIGLEVLAEGEPPMISTLFKGDDASGRVLISHPSPARIRVSSALHWSHDVDLLPGVSQVELAIWPSSYVVGKLAEGSEVPTRLSLSFQPSRIDAKTKPEKDPTGKSECSFEGRRFSCKSPASEAKLDLKLEASGLVPFYLWRRELSPAAELDLGSLKLEKGSSIAGWVELPPKTDPEKVEVLLEVSVTGFRGDPVLGAQLERKRRVAHVDEEGFFQIGGIEPGAWALSAQAPGRPPAAPLTLNIRRDEEYVVDEPLGLPEPGRLRIFLEPSGHHWKFSILEVQPRSQLEKVVRAETLDEGLFLELDDLPVGSFGFRVEDGNGGIWTSGDLEIIPGENPPLQIEIPQLEISGTLLSGKIPMAARILFGAMGEQQIPIEADEEGRFHGYLPRRGRWELAAEVNGAGYVALEPIELEEGASDLILHLPAARLEGFVYEDGKPAANALVLVKEEGGRGRVLATSTTDSKGRFRALGLAGGHFGLLAKTAERQSEWLLVEALAGSSSEEIRLDLLPSTRLEGRVSVQGIALPGAKVTAIPNVRNGGRGSALSGVDGTFEVILPAGTTEAGIIVLAQGYGAKLGQVSTSGQDIDLDMSLGAAWGDLWIRGIYCRPLEYTLIYGSMRLDLFDVLVSFLSVGRAVEGAGSLTLRGLAAGSYVVCENSSGKCLEAGVPVGGQVSVSFDPGEIGND